jgi:hypothetical protein
MPVACTDSPRESPASSISRGKETLSTAASEASDVGGADLKALQRDLSELKETLAKIIARAGDETAKSAREIAGQVTLLQRATSRREAQTLLPSQPSKPRAWQRSWRTLRVATRLVRSQARWLSEF